LAILQAIAVALSEAPLDAVELALTIETRFCVTIKVTKNDPKPLLRTQINAHTVTAMPNRQSSTCTKANPIRDYLLVAQKNWH
jgi:hypothetical protein